MSDVIPDQNPTPGQVLAGTPMPDQPPVTPAQPPAPPQPTPDQVADHNRHAAIGRAASFLFGNERDPNTGEPVPQKPGAVFRSLLAGALLGGAIGSEGRSSGGSVGAFLSGAARGGNAVAQQTYARQQQARQMTLEEQRAADEQLYRRAATAHLVAETTAFHHQQQWQDQESVDKKNAAAQQYIKSLLDDGAAPAAIAVDGKVSPTGTYSAPDLAAAVIKDPSILMGPKGTIRHFVDVHNASDLEYVQGKGWVDASGNPVDLSKSTVVSRTPLGSRKETSGRLDLSCANQKRAR